jgi:hypothetical protein
MNGMSYSDEVAAVRMTEYLRARYPDPRQLIAIISRSYDYIKKLPLNGLIEEYSRENPELFDLKL